MLAQKYCPRCDHDLPVAEFHHDASTPDQLTFYCSACRNAMARDLYERQRNQRVVRSKAAYERDTARILARRRELYQQRKHQEQSHDEDHTAAA
jgi:hypothetical protein